MGGIGFINEAGVDDRDAERQEHSEPGRIFAKRAPKSTDAALAVERVEQRLDLEPEPEWNVGGLVERHGGGGVGGVGVVVARRGARRAVVVVVVVVGVGVGVGELWLAGEL